jgi:adenosylcobyric acid synthase
LINKFRGDPALLTSGLDFLEQKTGVPVMGVVPYLRDHRLAEEDSLSLDFIPRVWSRTGSLKPKVAVIRLPRISNFDEFGPLLQCPWLETIFVEDPNLLEVADLVILPGSKNTLEDLDWLKSSGFAQSLMLRNQKGLEGARRQWLLGICGGCQMLGELIDDTLGVETEGRQGWGLGLLGVETRFRPEKRTVQCQVEPRSGGVAPRPWLLEALGSFPLKGYEIHAGQTSVRSVGDFQGNSGFFQLQTLSSTLVARHGDGVVSACGQVVGTMVHGLFENPGTAQALAGWLRRQSGFAFSPEDHMVQPSFDIYDGLADHLEQHLNFCKLDQAIFGKRGFGKVGRYAT